MERFELTTDHLKLLRRMNVGWSNCEFGAPEIDPKRPYGNSDVLMDIAEILDEPVFESAGGDRHLNPEQADRFERLHRETQTALQLCLSSGAFLTGVWERERSWEPWVRLAEYPADER